LGDRRFYIEENVEKSIEILKDVIEVLNRHKIEYYLDFGTLLGAVRDGKLIPWDDDIDISLLNEDDYKRLPEVLSTLRWDYGWRPSLLTYKKSYGRRVRKNRKLFHNGVDFTSPESYSIAKIRNHRFMFFGRGNCCVDIFCKYERDEKLYWEAYGKINSMPKELLKDGLTTIDFYGVECKIPKDYENYLEFKYGEEWRVPKKEWTHDGEDFSIEKPTYKGNS
jgi:phosphorylcholine metabolism protein LicD